ncbi:MAG TPA: alpha-amylase family glycosyl hydrolase [Opitutales bacterium]|nr:alpha-amylase family glycosyl hydrolase [Opitutales bacterium]
MKFYLYLSLAYLIALQTACAKQNPERPWNEDVIYFVMTDRFFDGDPANNRPAGSDPALYDPGQTDIDLYHGGDFRGLELALESGYFNDFGVTAIWITPPVRNVWNSSFDLHDAPKTGYHGYWTQDFLDIDPHLVSARSLDGRKYPDSREGRMQHYKDLVDLAHSKGIKIVQDIVCNHAGPVFYYDANDNGRFDRKQKDEWIQPYKESGRYDSAEWTNIPKWNLERTEPAATQVILGQKVPQNGSLAALQSFGRKGMSPGSLGASDGEEVKCDFFSLRDFNTAPDSGHFDALVDDFVEVYAFYIETIGVDGFRIDTVKHVHHEFWDAFTRRLRERLGPERAEKLILFGEVYDGNPVALGQYTYRSDWPTVRTPAIDSLLNFQFCYAVRNYLRTGDETFGTAHDIESAIRALSATPPPGRERPYYNQTPGPDGLNASQKIVNFVENHDGINRFRVRGVSEARHFLANALTLTMPGIPCLYYGSEVALQDEQAGPYEDAETGRLTYLDADESKALELNPKDDHFQAMAEIIRLRKELPALHGFEIQPLWVDSPAAATDDGIFAFARGGPDGSPIVVVMNAGKKKASTSIPGHRMQLIDSSGAPLLQPGEKLEVVPLLRNVGDTASVEFVWEGQQPKASITVSPESFHLFRVVE